MKYKFTNKDILEKVEITTPRRILYQVGWDVPTYREYKIKFNIRSLNKLEEEYFRILKDKIELSLCEIQEKALEGEISPAMYEMTIREFETQGESIKNIAVQTQDRFVKLKKQQEEQKNKSRITF